MRVSSILSTMLRLPSGFALAVLVLAMTLVAPAWAQKRVALVIGNAAYAGEKSLRNPLNDAADVAGVLQRTGFSVQRHQDLGRVELNRAVETFMRGAEGADLAVIYYSGHGMQAAGETFLIPTDAKIQSERDVRSEGVRLGELMDDLEARRIRRTVVILDACRDNPYRSRTRGGAKGLARPKEMDGAFLVAYATADGSTADDGDGRNGVYTAQLLKQLERGGTQRNLREVMEDTQLAVEEATRGTQRPKLYGDTAKFRDVFLQASVRAEPVRPGPDTSPAQPARQPAVPVAPLLPPMVQNYPSRPITLIVPWGAGGGTDATARMLGSLLEKELGQPLEVVNRTGGSGVVGHSAIAAAAPDGYTIGMATVEVGMMHRQGLTQLTAASYTPVGLVSVDPSVISVRADAPYRTVGDLLAAIKAQPGRFKASGTGSGGLWHLAIMGLLQDQKIDPSALSWVPSNGATPALQDLVAGKIELAPVSLPEARSLLDAGKIRTLAVMAASAPASHPGIPTLRSATGSDWTMSAWRGIVAPQGLPMDIRDRLAGALRKVVASRDYRDFMAARAFGVSYAGPEEFGRFMAASDIELGAAMTAAGVAR